jgi:hypothetical protein
VLIKGGGEHRSNRDQQITETLTRRWRRRAKTGQLASRRRRVRIACQLVRTADDEGGPRCGPSGFVTRTRAEAERGGLDPCRASNKIGPRGWAEGPSLTGQHGHPSQAQARSSYRRNAIGIWGSLQFTPPDLRNRILANTARVATQPSHTLSSSCQLLVSEDVRHFCFL